MGLTFVQMHSVIFWNTRGLGKAEKQRDLETFIHSYKPRILGMVEVKLRQSRIPKLKLKLWRRAGSLTSVSPQGKVRIWLLWDQENVKINLILQDSQALIVKCSCLESGHEWFLNLTYANNFEQERKVLWKLLEETINLLPGPWLVAGDFNCFRFQDEKIGGNHISGKKTGGIQPIH